MSNNKLSSMEMDAIGEILNISLGASATAVSTMLDARVDITTPVVSVKTEDEFEFKNLEPAVCIEITYVKGLEGSNVMLLKREDVKVIVEMLMRTEIPDDEFELNEMYISAICEVMNMMMGASATALSELLSKTVDISPPKSFEVDDVRKFKEQYFSEGNAMAVVSFNLKIADKMESEFMNLMPLSLAKGLVAGFFPDGVPEEPTDQVEMNHLEAESSGAGDRPMSQEEIEAMLAASNADSAPAPAAEAAPASADDGGGRTMTQEEIEAMLAASNGDSAPAMEAAPAPAAPAPAPAAAPVAAPMAAAPAAAPAGSSEAMMQQMMTMMQQQMDFQNQQMQAMQAQMQSGPRNIKVNAVPAPSLKPDNAATDENANVDLIMGVALDVSVEIGRTKKLIKDILELNKGSLVVLDKLAGEQVDVFVNGECIAKGDVIVVEDNFGVRITEILQDELPTGKE